MRFPTVPRYNGSYGNIENIRGSAIDTEKIGRFSKRGNLINYKQCLFLILFECFGIIGNYEINDVN